MLVAKSVIDWTKDFALKSNKKITFFTLPSDVKKQNIFEINVYAYIAKKCNMSILLIGTFSPYFIKSWHFCDNISPLKIR